MFIANNKKALVVEDDIITQVVLKSYLERLGFQEVLTADNSQDALSVIESSRPDLIFMDIIIKGDIDGVETIKKINPQLNIPFVYTTASTDRVTLNRALQSQPAKFINKPYDFEDIKNFLEQLN